MDGRVDQRVFVLLYCKYSNVHSNTIYLSHHFVNFLVAWPSKQKIIIIIITHMQLLVFAITVFVQ